MVFGKVLSEGLNVPLGLVGQQNFVSLRREPKLTDEPGQLAQFVSFAHQAVQHVVDG